MANVTLENGKRLTYDDYDFTPPWVQAEPVVLIHGFSKNRKFWFEWIPHLAQHYRVIVPDLFGHGDSDPLPADFKMALRPFSDDLALFLKALDLKSAHFVMAEFSSVVALDFAVAHPSIIRSLVLPGFLYKIGSSGIDWEAWARLIEKKGSIGWARATNNTRLPADVDPAKREWYVTQQGRFPAVHLAGLFRFIKTLDLSPNLPLVQMPALLMTGDQAVQEPPDSVRRAATLMPRAQLKIFPGMPMNVMSACPDLAIAETLRFLREIKQ